MRDRYLFSADRKASEYRGVLEITPGRARLLTPSQSGRQVRWIVSIALALAYVYVASSLIVPFTIAGSVIPVIGWILLVAAMILWFAGLIAVFLWWDRKSLLFLAEGPVQAMDLILLGARSFGTFQDVRARTREGEEMQLVVDARAPRFWEAVRLLEGRGPAAG